MSCKTGAPMNREELETVNEEQQEVEIHYPVWNVRTEDWQDDGRESGELIYN